MVVDGVDVVMAEASPLLVLIVAGDNVQDTVVDLAVVDFSRLRHLIWLATLRLIDGDLCATLLDDAGIIATCSLRYSCAASARKSSALGLSREFNSQ